MRPSIAITLILCGTLIAAMPIIAHRLGMQIADAGFLCYWALAAAMVGAAIVGSFRPSRVPSVHGFEPVITAAE